MNYNSFKVRKLTYILLAPNYVSIELVIISLFVATFVLVCGHGVMSNIDAPCDLLVDEGLLGGGDWEGWYSYSFLSLDELVEAIWLPSHSICKNHKSLFDFDITLLYGFINNDTQKKYFCKKVQMANRKFKLKTKLKTKKWWWIIMKGCYLLCLVGSKSTEVPKMVLYEF